MSCLVCTGLSPLGWLVCEPKDLDSDIAIHVIPENDIWEHLLDADGKCWCDPGIDDQADELIFWHNAQDERESFVRGLRLPS
jgi:hypothetical protein